MGDETREYTKPEGARSVHTITVLDRELTYAAEADWLVLHRDEKPVAEIFHVYYAVADEERTRPLTFVFNGGPGAASAYLHVGATEGSASQPGSEHRA